MQSKDESSSTTVSEHPGAPRVTVDSGELEGTWVSAPGKSDVAAFLGVPYAKPPVDERRWHPPEQPDSWSGVRQAKWFGSACLQAESNEYFESMAQRLAIDLPESRPREYAEDCLYLNVFSESLGIDARRPVMVWIHGGGFNFGHASRYDPQHLVRKGVVGVTINYRLAALGFMAHPELSEESPNETSGNYGLLDQIESLKWIKRNIAAFGGNPDNVTIFGESAGGMAVALLMVSPMARGLFHRGIAQSGIGLNFHRQQTKNGPVHDSAESWGLAFAASMGGKSIAALRAMDAEPLVEAATDFNKEWAVPHIDGHVIVEHPVQSFREGKVHPVPFMLGSNADEGGMNYPFVESFMHELPGPIDTVEKYRAGIHQIFGTDAERVLSLYPANTQEEMVKSSIDLLGDTLFGAQEHYVAVHLARAGKAPYLYFLTRKPAGELGETMGAHHGLDISYVFGTEGFSPKTEDDWKMSARMMNYWVQFARTGDPNSADNPQWAPFDVAQNQYMEFGEAAAMTDVARMDRYDVIEAFYDQF